MPISPNTDGDRAAQQEFPASALARADHSILAASTPEAMASNEGRRLMRRRTFLKLAPVPIVIALSPIRSVLAAASTSSVLNIVAHEDDDLLFLSPTVLHAVQGGSTVCTIFVTAGDAGNSETYWMGRQNGMQAAYAEMAGVSNSWNQADAGISGHPMPLFTLSAMPAISLIFMHLPDGNPNGTGYSRCGGAKSGLLEAPIRGRCVLWPGFPSAFGAS